MAPELLPGIGAAVAMVAGAVVRAWYRERREDRRAEEKRRTLTPATGHALLPAPDCARHASGHAESLARTHARINQVLEMVQGSDKRIDALAARLDRILDRLDDIKDWTRPTGEK